MKAPGCNDASRTAPTNAARRTIAANWIRSDLETRRTTSASARTTRQARRYAAQLAAPASPPAQGPRPGRLGGSSRSARLSGPAPGATGRDDIPSSSGPMPASASTSPTSGCRVAFGTRPPFSNRRRPSPIEASTRPGSRTAITGASLHQSDHNATMVSVMRPPIASSARLFAPCRVRPHIALSFMSRLLIVQMPSAATPLAPRAVKAPGLAHSKRPGCAVEGELSRQVLPSASDFPASQSIREVHVLAEDGRANRGVFAPAA